MLRSGNEITGQKAGIRKMVNTRHIAKMSKIRETTIDSYVAFTYDINMKYKLTKDIRITASRLFWKRFSGWQKKNEIQKRNLAFLRAAQIAMEKKDT
jgi:hypothetical protein